MKLTIEISEKHAHALMQACEVLARCGMGQFKSLADVIVPWSADNQSSCDRCSIARHEKVDGFETMAKLLMMPELYRAGYYAMHNNKVPGDCQRAWECYAAFRYALAWARLAAEGKTVPEFHGNQYDEPMGVSGEPMPVVTVESLIDQVQEN